MSVWAPAETKQITNDWTFLLCKKTQQHRNYRVYNHSHCVHTRSTHNNDVFTRCTQKCTHNQKQLYHFLNSFYWIWLMIREKPQIRRKLFLCDGQTINERINHSLLLIVMTNDAQIWMYRDLKVYFLWKLFLWLTKCIHDHTLQLLQVYRN